MELVRVRQRPRSRTASVAAASHLACGKPHVGGIGAIGVLALVFSLAFTLQTTLASEAVASKPRAAVFPLAGTASEEGREKAAYSLRAKLAADGAFEPIDGPTMSDIASGAPVPLSATPDHLRALVSGERPSVLIWGELDGNTAKTLHLKILDLRDADPKPLEFAKAITEPGDLRFAVEQMLQTIHGVRAFAHPSEQGEIDDAASEMAWRKNPNLLPDADFAQPLQWRVHLRSQDDSIEVSSDLPGTDKACVYRIPGHSPAAAAHDVLAMRLSSDTALSDGLACVSAPFRIEPNTRYRLRFSYRSEGPSLHVFVKGYAASRGSNGERGDRENYRRQVPPSGETGGKWVTVVDDLNPQNPAGPVESLRVDLYGYGAPGLLMFDELALKAVGVQEQSPDSNAATPATRP